MSPFVVIVGATASGKSDLSLRIAREFSGEIINCDSIQVYKKFDIGSAKPSTKDQDKIRHYLINICDWGEGFDAGRYAELARQAIEEVVSRGKLPIVVGGTGLYLRALLEDRFHNQLPKDEAIREQLKEKPLNELYESLKQMDPKRCEELHPNDRVRIERALEINLISGCPVSEMIQTPREKTDSPFTIYLNPPKELLLKKIESRCKHMIDEGLVEEVKSLLEVGVDPASKPMQSIGYRQVNDMLQGLISEKDLAESMVIATRQYAKKQRTWFRQFKFNMTLETTNDFALAEVFANLGKYLKSTK